MSRIRNKYSRNKNKKSLKYNEEIKMLSVEE
jgi:hypothetical protein